MRAWLRILRKNLGLTQKEVASLLGISVQYYNFIETGKRQVELSLCTASKISDVFNISLSTIRNYEEELQERRK